MVDGKLLFETGIDNSGFDKGISSLTVAAGTAIGNIAANMVSQISEAVAQIPTQMIAVGSGFEASITMNWKRKLSSRKFWAAVSGVVISVMVAFNAEAGSQEKVAGVITATGTLAIYMLAEGSTDKAAVSTAKEDEKSDSEE